jgi:hypothetical protein
MAELSQPIHPHLLLPVTVLAKRVSTTANEAVESASRHGRQRLDLIHRLAARVSSGVSFATGNSPAEKRRLSKAEREHGPLVDGVGHSSSE